VIAQQSLGTKSDLGALDFLLHLGLNCTQGLPEIAVRIIQLSSTLAFCCSLGFMSFFLSLAEEVAQRSGVAERFTYKDPPEQGESR
jgi:hypothetical protein